jgi:hypothetical protein
MVNAFSEKARACDPQPGANKGSEPFRPPRLVCGAGAWMLAFRHGSVPDIVDSGAAGHVDSVKAHQTISMRPHV